MIIPAEKKFFAQILPIKKIDHSKVVYLHTSMPLFGRLPFLHVLEAKPFNERDVCQCPYSGNFLFYHLSTTIQILAIMRVNALIRATSFSTYSTVPKLERQSRSVNALIRATSFSTLIRIEYDSFGIWCQCPYSGDILFY